MSTTTLKFNRTRKDQVRVVHLMDALSGREPSPTCGKCGGTLDNKGPSLAHCSCPVETPPGTWTNENGRAVVLVGESNPYSVQPGFALYDLPHGASGHRLRLILGLESEAYQERCQRHNLCWGVWRLTDARREALRLLALYPNATFILLGKRVASAFRFKGSTYTTNDLSDHQTILSLPHPSGRCRVWSEPGARDRAREAVRRACPGLLTGGT